MLGGIVSGLMALTAVAPTAQAQEAAKPANGPKAKAVLELFTSQGCSSCPAADALLESYTKRADVIALTWPVDYWDYLGWKDTLAAPKFTARQKYYAKHRGDGRVYTPQMVINGLTHAVGNSAREIDQAVAATGAQLAQSDLSVTIRLDQKAIVIEAGAGAPGTGIRDATIWLVMIQRSAEVVVRSGENRDKTLRYFNVVREVTPVGMWSTGKPLVIRLDRDTVKLPDTDAAAVLIQVGKAGPIVGAAILPKL